MGRIFIAKVKHPEPLSGVLDVRPCCPLPDGHGSQRNEPPCVSMRTTSTLVCPKAGRRSKSALVRSRANRLADFAMTYDILRRMGVKGRFSMGWNRRSYQRLGICTGL